MVSLASVSWGRLGGARKRSIIPPVEKSPNVLTLIEETHPYPPSVFHHHHQNEPAHHLLRVLNNFPICSYAIQLTCPIVTLNHFIVA
jgi:hypothetical protein